MNYLELCQRLVREAPITGNGPTSVVGQTGSMRQVVGWVNSAYLSIQAMHPGWLFMADEFEFPTKIGESTYTPVDAGISNLETWSTKQCDMKIYESLHDEGFVTYLPWEQFRLLLVGNGRILSGRPTTYTIKPNNSLMFYPIPDKDYMVTGQYHMQPVSMTANTDIPIFPAKYHEAIMWLALTMYCAYVSIPDLYAQANDKYRLLVRKLEMEQLPRIKYGAPLA